MARLREAPTMGRAQRIAAIVAEIHGLITERAVQFGIGPSDIRQQALQTLQDRENEYQQSKQDKAARR